jgi:hypothetical protein
MKKFILFFFVFDYNGALPLAQGNGWIILHCNTCNAIGTTTNNITIITQRGNGDGGYLIT